MGRGGPQWALAGPETGPAAYERVTGISTRDAAAGSM